MKIENWSRYEIRFVEIKNEWWAVTKGATDALGFSKLWDAVKALSQKYKGVHRVPTLCDSLDLQT